MFKVPESSRVRNHPVLASMEKDGCNGAFFVESCESGWSLWIIASDEGLLGQEPWEHVSCHAIRTYMLRASPRQAAPKSYVRIPTWKEMCYVKDLFWDDEDVVMQLHPKKSEYINCHPYALHLWRPTISKIPQPLSLMVGIDLVQLPDIDGDI